MPLRQRRRTSLALTGLALGLTTLASAQDKPPAEDLSPEQQLLGDFGSGIRVIGYFAKNDEDISLENVNLRELMGAAEDALFSEESDKEMSIYLDDYEANQQREELDQFGNELKRAVDSGEMSGQDAWLTWFQVMGDDDKAEDGSERTWEQRFSDHVRSGRMAGINLRIPDGGDMRVLTRPEFLRRDLQYFGRELELDESTRAIIEVLLEDYVTAYEQRTRELLDAVRSTRISMGRQWRQAKVSQAREGIDALTASVDLDLIRDRIANDDRFGGKGEWMMNAIDRYEGAIGEIQQAVNGRYAALQREPAPEASPSDVLGMAARLQADRTMMRTQLIESMMLVLNERQQRGLENIFDQFILEQARVDSKLGGSKIDLELALAMALDGSTPEDPIRDALNEINLELVALADNWTNARINRERSGLELFVVAESQGESGAQRLTGTHAQRARTELEAALSIRDRLMAAQEELAALLAENDAAAADRFRTVTREQGFAPQMRSRWSERALNAILSCDGIDAEQRTALTSMQDDLAQQLTPIRLDAIQQRMVTEPRIVRSRIRKMTDPDTAEREPLGMERWQEAGSEQFRALDDQVNSQFETLMIAPQCLETMPRRRDLPEALDKGENQKGEGKMGGAGKGDAKASGKNGGKGTVRGGSGKGAGGAGGGKGGGRAGSSGKP